jgi:hypothetical protein
MRLTAIVLLVSAGGAPAQRPVPAGAVDVSSSTASSKADTALLGWRNGLEISVNGSTWDRALTVTLSKVQCPPSPTSPCAAGSAVAVDVRFPPVAQATDLSKVHAELGEISGATGSRYEVRLVRNQSSPLCDAGFVTSSAYASARMAINVGAPGPPLPLTCRWTALIGIPDPANASHVAVIWSDTVVVQLTSKP